VQLMSGPPLRFLIIISDLDDELAIGYDAEMV
jgi:hypothetical protein